MLLTTAGGWMFAPGFAGLDSERVEAILLRRMELQLPSLLGALRAGPDRAAITAEQVGLARRAEE